MVDLKNPIISVIVFNVNGLNIPVLKDCEIGTKTRHNCMLSAGNLL